jgi:hypothetical protein
MCRPCDGKTYRISDFETELHGLENDLPKMDSGDHRDYVTLAIGEMKRELRIWRDHYWDYLDNLNRASRATKRRIGLDLAVAPVAAIRLARRGSGYLAHSHVDPIVFKLIFVPQKLVYVALDDKKCVAPPEMNIADMMTRLVPQTSFRKSGHEQGFIAGGPFALPPVPQQESMVLHELNQVWISSLCRMWDEVLCEMMTQYFLVDQEKRAYVLRAEERLPQFQWVAGSLYLRYLQIYGASLPEHAWTQLAEILDQRAFQLEDNLEPQGKEALKDAVARCGHDINTWAQAFAYRAIGDWSVRKDPRPQDDTHLYLGDLTRHAKKAVYRAKDAVENARNEPTS